jgi:hypothetical protein
MFLSGSRLFLEITDSICLGVIQSRKMQENLPATFSTLSIAASPPINPHYLTGGYLLLLKGYRHSSLVRFKLFPQCGTLTRTGKELERN